MAENLLDPLFLFFAVGVIAGLLKSDVRLPDAVYQLLSTYLLLAIGLRGGIHLAQADGAEFAGPAVATVGLGIVTPILAFLAARGVGRLSRADAAGLAAHYGSVSAVTFAVVVTALHRENRPFEEYMAVLLVLLEVPAILVALAVHRFGERSTSGASFGTVVHEVLLNRSVFLLFAGLAVGFVAGPERFEPFALLFEDAFRPLLAFFILEMGLLAAGRLSDLRRHGWFVVVFAIVMPVVGASLAVGTAWLVGMSAGGAQVLATMVASASYIAAPAAVRLAIPEANTGLAVAASLGVTFPFNLAIGIPLYGRMVEMVYG